MANSIRRYWDASTCLRFLAKRADGLEECERVLADARMGGCELVISGITIAEVLHLKGQGRSFDRGSRETVRNFFRQSIFIVADVDRFVAERAADLFWDREIMPKDALHVATALAVEAHFLETFDGPLIDRSRQVGGDPQLVIQRPGKDLAEKAAAKTRKKSVAQQEFLSDPYRH